MLKITLDRNARVAILEPDGALEKSDFEIASAQIDPLIEEAGALSGLIIKVERFPGWESFAALIAHLKFVRAHHREVKRIAFVTHSAVGHLAETVGSHFVAAEIREFPFDQLHEARQWVVEP